MKFKLPKQKRVFNRRDLIIKASEKGSVLHFGCTDSPYTEERLNNGTLLHQQLQNTTSYLAGVDINDNDITLMKSYGIEELFSINLYDFDSKILPDKKFDLIILSEVLEHLPNASEALKVLRSFMMANNPKAKIIITVPNINSYFRNVFDFLRNVEQVHPDHLSYFSYVTLKNLLEFNGFTISTFYYATYGLRPIFAPIVSLLNLISSSFMPCLFVIAEPVKTNGKK